MDAPDDRERSGSNPVDALLLEALERLTAGENDVVERLCEQHPEAADELRERADLLRDMQLLPSDAAAMAFPERLGEFRLLRRLGGGGMGVVYEAVQEPLGRTVALKLIRPEHLYFEQSRERFRRETEAVARLAHPGIVTIHTVGEAQGAPYFAMEMIHGATLDQALQQVAGISPESLLGSDLRAAVLGASPPDGGRDPEHIDDLFAGTWVEACTRIALRMTEALSHAHGRGVLHRDIKPSNIAVTLEGRVVLLDFGLAGIDDNLRMTSAGSTLGSVLYMAPEQLAGRNEEIDERTDVYALGVTLYELLALEPPFARADSTQTRAAILEGQAPSIRARRQGVPRDLEIVCLHAMEHDRSRRYASMEAFGGDLRAVLEGRPISARPPSASYRARRWVARHPAISTAVLLGALLITVLPTALYVQQRSNSRQLEQALAAEKDARARAADSERRAKLDADQADQVTNFLVDLFAASDPYSSGRRDLRASDVLDQGVDRVAEELRGQPELQARMLERIGQSYINLDLYNQALEPLDRALELRRGLHGDDDLRTAGAKTLVASAARLAGRDGGEALLRSAIATFEANPDEAADDLVGAWSLLGMYRVDAGDAAEALELLSRSRAALRDGPDASRAQRWMILAMTASAQRQLGRSAEAEATAREALEMDREISSRTNPWRLAALEDLALALADQGDFDGALSTFDVLLPDALSFYGEDNAVFAAMKLDHLGLLQDSGLGTNLSEQLQGPAEVLRQRLGVQHNKTIRALDRLAISLVYEGRYQEALELLREELSDLDARVGPNSAQHATPTFRLGAALEASGELVEAEEASRRACELVRSLDASSRASADLQLASTLLRDRSSFAEASELAERWKDEGHPLHRVFAHFLLARIDLLEGRGAAAEQRLRDALALENGAARVSWMEAACLELLSELRIARGELTPACGDLTRALRDLELGLGARHHEVLEARRRVQQQGLDRACEGAADDR